MDAESQVDWNTVPMAPLPETKRAGSGISKARLVALISTGISICLLLTASSIIYVVWKEMDSIARNRPPEHVIISQNNHRTMTGMDNLSGSGVGVSICIVDTGIDLTHPEFTGRNLSAWKDFVNEEPSPYDDEGHGTMMAGLIWADKHLKGVATGVDLLVAKALSADGQGVDETIAEAVDWCVSSGTDVISMSLGGAAGFDFFLSSTDQLENAVNAALDAGVFVVAAAGNDGTDDDGDVASPGSVEDVICVGGVDYYGNIWEGSSEGDNNGRILPLPPLLPRQNPDMKPELVAPGTDVPVLVYSRDNDLHTYGHASGTSASTAWVAGALALVIEAHPDIAPDGSSGGRGAIDDVKGWIQASSTGQEGHDDHYGYGILNVEGLLQAANA